MALDNTPAAEVDIDHDLVRRLLAEQLPELSTLPLERFAEGWDNVIFRLGDELTVRLPRREMAAELVAHEQRWLPEIASRLPLPIPSPVRIGRPGRGYPWSWSVCPWLPGEIAQRTPPADLFAAAAVLGEFLAALHQPAPDDAPVNRFRGVPLRDRAETMNQRVVQLGNEIDPHAVMEAWELLVATPPRNGPAVWLHGDLHPANVLVHDGKVAAVIDFGDITSGDRATDLSIGWMLFPPGPRERFRAAAGSVDDDTWARARGWALTLAVTYLATSADDPVIEREARRTIAEVLAETGTG